MLCPNRLITSNHARTVSHSVPLLAAFRSHPHAVSKQSMSSVYVLFSTSSHYRQSSTLCCIKGNIPAPAQPHNVILTRKFSSLSTTAPSNMSNAMSTIHPSSASQQTVSITCLLDIPINIPTTKFCFEICRKTCSAKWEHKHCP